jgi:hypothetical protein
MTKEKEYAEEVIVAGWHLKKEVTIGQLVTLICILVSGLWWASSVETRLNGLHKEDERIEQKADIVIKNINAKFDLYQKDIERALGRIERKQDKIFDKLDEKADK